MLAALTLAAATALPTISISVHASSPRVSGWMLNFALDEARAIWIDAGLRISWRIEKERAAADGLRVVIDDDPGTGLGEGLAIGWVIFQGDQPTQEIHLSYANAVAGLERSCPLGALNRLNPLRIDEMVAVALGRALAHELGHYLLGPNAHSGSGLMRAEWSPAEMFGESRPFFHLDAVQRGAIASKLMTEAVVTKR